MSSIKLITGFLPLFAFFIFYKLYDLYIATIAICICSVFALIISFKSDKKLSLMPLISTIILVIMSSLTYLLDNSMFIKMKPTMLNILFASILFFGTLKGKGFIKYLLNTAFELSEDKWITISKRWGLFFLFLAFLNEVIWRNFSEEIWVNFKVFAIIPLTFIFTLMQLPFLIKNSKKTIL